MLARSSSSTARGSRLTALAVSLLWITATVITVTISYRISTLARQRTSQVIVRSLARRVESHVDSQCSLANVATDSCQWVRDHCPEEEAGLFSYLQMYYCGLGTAQPIALVIIILWLCLLFSTIGIAASDFFSVNLSTIAALLGLSEDLAGVTFLAFGNGSPDVFSTFAAMSTHSGSMAIGELVGAAGFITAVVAGSMALIRPFRVPRNGFVRDVTFFICASALTMVVLADGQLLMWECILMVSFYVAYVNFVVVWHWFRSRKSARFAREARIRSNFVANETAEEAVITPTGNMTGNNAFEDLPAQYAGRRESYGPSDPVGAAADIDDSDANSQQHVIAEINRNMRVSRPRHHSRRPTGTPIRPSLVGALEFRAVLSSLEKSRNQVATPIGLRRYSDDPTFARSQRPTISTHSTSQATPESSAGPSSLWSTHLDVNDSTRSTRGRAVSVNDATLIPSKPASIAQFDAPPRLSLDTNDLATTRPTAYQSSPVLDPAGSSSLQPSMPAARFPLFRNTSHTDTEDRLRATDGTSDFDADPRTSSNLLLPSGTPGSSPLAPFPVYQDEPPSPGTYTRSDSFKLPPPRLDVNLGQVTSEQLTNPKRLRWWPHRVFPKPEEFFATLFPTLYRWRDKTIWERLIGIAAAPSVFLLTITLPVVDERKISESEFEEIATDAPNVPVVNVTEADDPPSEHLVPRIAIDASSEDSPLLLQESEEDTGGPRSAEPSIGPSHNRTGSFQSGMSLPLYGGGSVTEAESQADFGWQRWLVSLQVVMAPVFVTLIVWANVDEGGSLWRLLLWEAGAMAGSVLIIVAVFKFTDPDHPPKYRPLLCFAGFIVSVAWISTIANEVVGVLKALGIIFQISEAILGLTVFAVGNSLGDLVADITIARLGYPVMAFSACIGGPMLNILLGIGLGGLYMTIKEGQESNTPAWHNSFHIEVGSTLIVSCIALLTTLVGLLVAVPLNKWMIDRKIGLGLLALWVVATIVNLGIELSGTGRGNSIVER